MILLAHTASRCGDLIFPKEVALFLSLSANRKLDSQKREDSSNPKSKHSCKSNLYGAGLTGTLPARLSVLVYSLPFPHTPPLSGGCVSGRIYRISLARSFLVSLVGTSRIRPCTTPCDATGKLFSDRSAAYICPLTWRFLQLTGEAVETVSEADSK